jgi:hypothetical protein
VWVGSEIRDGGGETKTNAEATASQVLGSGRGSILVDIH